MNKKSPFFFYRLYLLIVILLFASAIVWYRIGHLSPAFATEVPFGAEYLVGSNFDGAYSAAAADLDGDGDLDLVAAAKNAGDIVWWENLTGDGTSWSMPHIVSDAFPGAIDAVPADVDRDGDLDLVGASASTGDLIWWDNVNGDGSVWNPNAFDSFLDETTGIFVADINKDGAPDIAAVGTVGSGESVIWYENAGDGTSWTRRTVAIGLDTPTAVVVADLDRDGHPDLIVSSLSSTEISWWRNNNGNGLSWTIFALSSEYFGADGIHLADLDGDGDLDLIGAFASDDTIAWRENNGAGQGWTAHPITTAFSDPVSVTAIDLDGDGDLDVIGAGHTADQILWWENTDAQGTTWLEYPVSTFFNGARAVGAADINGDGLADIFGAAEIADEVIWWQNGTIHRNAYFPGELAVVVDDNMDGAFSIAAADLDRDGYVDLIAGAANTGEVAWYRNNLGDGTSWTKNSVGSLSGVRSVFVADLDRNGTLDVLAAGTTACDIVWWPNNGNGGFGSIQVIDTVFGGAFWVAAGDLDGDGDLDVLGAGFTADEIAWWENLDGNGNFGARNVVASGYDGATSVSAADIDGDGDLDVVGSSYLTNTISWWENTAGNGSAWTPHTMDGAIAGPVSTVAADMDGDGDLDVVGAANLAQEFSWWENLDGQGTFDPVQTVIGASFDNAESVFVADLDLDGDWDVVGAAQNDHTVVWFENDGGQWITHILTDTLQEAVAVHVADVDKDGRPDILSAAAVDNAVHWWGNRGGQFSLVTVDTSPLAIIEGTTTDVMAITATHHGRENDSLVELVAFEFLFEEKPGNNMGPPEANALIENLYVYLDTGSGSFEQNQDTLVLTIETLTLILGLETIEFPPGNPDFLLTPGESKVYFIVIEFTPDANSQNPNQVLLTHLTNEPSLNSSAQDEDYDIPLLMAYAPSVQTFLEAFAPDLFIRKFANEGLPNLHQPEPGTSLGEASIIEPGELITYTILYSNTGNTEATGVIITDWMPPEALYTDFTYSGITATLTITDGDRYVWELGSNLPPHTSGTITILATLDSLITEEYTFLNTAILTGTIGGTTFDAISVAPLEINIPPLVVASGDQTASIGQLVHVTATFTDPGLDDLHLAFINWGDGIITPGVVPQASGTVFGAHRYFTQGSYEVTILVVDSDGGRGSDTFLITVGDAILYLPVLLRP